MNVPHRKRLTAALLASLGVAVAGASAQSVGSAATQTDLGDSYRQVSLDIQPAGLTSQQRASGVNAKLDNRLINIRDAHASVPQVAKATTSAASAPSDAAASDTASETVTVEIVTKGDATEAAKKLQALGFRLDAIYKNHLGGDLPVGKIDAAASIGDVKQISAVQRIMHSGSVNGQGDFAQRSRALRSALKGQVKNKKADSGNLLGTGITVGVLSDSFNCFADLNGLVAGLTDDDGSPLHLDDMTDDIATGDVPGSGRIRILKEGSQCLPDKNGRHDEDEGRAMAEIIHDIAPGAKIAFYAPSSPADFAQGIQTLALPAGKNNALGTPGGGADVIVDDIGFGSEPVFQSGIVGEAVDDVVADGKLYFTAAGNGSLGAQKVAYMNNDAVFRNAPIAQSTDGKGASNIGERPLNFDTSGKTGVYSLPVHSIQPLTDKDGKPITDKSNHPLYGYYFDVNWDQPSDASISSLNVCVGDAQGHTLKAVELDDDGKDTGKRQPACSGPSVLDQSPRAIVAAVLPVKDATLRIGLADGSAPKRILTRTNPNQTPSVVFDRFGTDKGTIQGHPLSPSALTLGAADYLDTPACDPSLATAKLENFSSHGGSLLTLDNQNKPLAHPYAVQKPDSVAPDGASSVFFGGPGRNKAGSTTSIAQCRYYTGYQHNFYGTSAAAPHAAAVAALLLQAFPKTAPKVVYKAMTDGALSMRSDTKGYDYATGAGLLQADQAYEALKKATQAQKDAPAIPIVIVPSL